MALDGIFLRHIKKEIEQEALGARVNQIYQPNRDELVLILRTFAGQKSAGERACPPFENNHLNNTSVNGGMEKLPTKQKKLLLSSRANSPRVNFCVNAPENPAQPPMFCMLLRKRLGGGKLVGVRQLGCDRVLFLDFECVNELGETEGLSIVCEIMGMYSNLIVLNRDTGVIIDALKRVDLTVSSRRFVLPNIPYELPERQNKLNILEHSPGEIANAAQALPSETVLSKALMQVVEGISPIVARELEFRVAEGATNRVQGALRDKLLAVLGDFKAVAEGCGETPCIVYREDGRPMDFSFFPILQYGDFAQTKATDGFSATVDEFYEERDARERMRVKSHSLQKLLTNAVDRTARKINKQRAELAQCGNREQLRIYGDLLHANLYRIERGAAYADVENFYDENGGTVRIKLNPAVSPAANAQKYYKDYQKAKTAETVLAEQIEKGERELDYLESVLDALSRAESERDLSQIREELTEQGYLRRPKGKVQKQAKLAPKKYRSSDGFTILVGRNNRQNDTLTLKTAAKTDLWLHTKDIHGSHVIIRCDGQPVSETALLEAAQLAAYHSKARESSNVPVDYTLVKHVSKPAGAKPGMVIYVKNKTVYVDPKEHRGKAKGAGS